MPPASVANQRRALLSWVEGNPKYQHLLGQLTRKGTILDGILRQVLREAPAGAGEVSPKGEDPTRWSVKQRIAANMRALRTYRTLTGSMRLPSPEQHEALLRYSGWGGIDPMVLKTDPEIPEEVNAAITDWQTAVREQRIPTTNLFRGVLDQFFTPLSVCRAMWALAQRSLVYPLRYALEPSAGIGRFLQAQPEGVSPAWTLIERDPFLAEFASVVWPQAVVEQTLFEAVVARSLNDGSRYDLILMNPPYGTWGARGQKLDPGMVPYANDVQTYFVKRALDLLAVGGVMVAITTAGQMTGKSEENRNLRRFLLGDGHLLGSALIGSEIFEKLGAAPAGGLAIHAWTRLPEGARERIGYSQRDRAILEGTYFTATSDGQASVLGTWGANRFGQQVVQGPFDEVATGHIPITHLPAGVLPAETPHTQPPTSIAAPPRPSRVQSQRPKAHTEYAQADRDPYEEAPYFEMRLQRFFEQAQAGPEGQDQARAGQAELVLDLQDFVASCGNPHNLENAAAEYPWLTRIVDAQGVVHPGLLQGAEENRIQRPKDVSSPDAVLRWYSRSNGVCHEIDLLREFPSGDIREIVLTSPDLALEILHPGDPENEQRSAYTQADYVAGDLYRRLDLLQQVLAGPYAEDESLRARLETQKEWLMEAISPRVITDIDVRPHSGFVPLEALSDYATETIAGQDTKGEDAIGIEIYKDTGRFRCRTNGVLAAEPQGWGRSSKKVAKETEEARRKELIFLMGYLNRELEVCDPDELEAKQYRRYKSEDPTERKAEDTALEESFRTWIAKSDRWRPIVEEAYNRAFRSDHARDYPTTPFPLLRLSPSRKPHGHQWAGARRMAERGSALFNWAVGAGKTIGAGVSIATLRQQGKIRRPIVIMPNSILTTWIAEMALLLPDYRVGTIGVTYDPDRNMYRSDTGREDERLAKWKRFAAGGYDLLLCTYSAFERDVFVDPQVMMQVLGRVEWMERGLGKDQESRRLIERKIGDAESEIRVRERNLQGLVGANDIAREKAKIQALQGNIERWQASLKEPSKTALAAIQEALEENIESGVFRPAGAPGIIRWEDLGVDFLAVDEGHNFKNLYYPGGRYGAQQIAYMGAARASENWTDFTLQAWDLFLKTSSLTVRNGSRGILVLTATPVKNSPLEVYSIFSYLSPDIWTSRQIMSGEEWIDRFLEIEPKTYPTVDGGLRTDLAVVGFSELNQPELNDVFQIWMYRLTTADLINLGLIPKDAVPDGKEIPAEVNLDPLQRKIYDRMKELIQMEREIAEEAGIPTPGAVNLTRLDMGSKVTVDPRLLLADIGIVEERLVLDTWVTTRARPDHVVVEYTPPEVEDEGVAEQIEEIIKIRGGRNFIRVVQIDAEPVLARLGSGKGRKGKGQAIPEKKPLTEIQRANLERRYIFLRNMGLEEVFGYYDESQGITPPKYELIAREVAQSGGCGSLIFADYNGCHAYLRDALVHIGGLSPDRVAFLTAEAAKSLEDRATVALDFNGTDRIVHPISGALLQEAQDPKFDAVIGHTRVMGEGLNLQRRTCAVYHVDIPWDPATLQQRNGRAARQGNTLGEVEIRLLVARRSLDMKRKDTILGKVSWQEALLSGATAGSISLDQDWSSVMIAEFASTPEEAEALIQKAREEEAVRTKRRLVKEAVRDLRTLVGRYARARQAQDPKDRQIELSLTDRMVPALARTLDRIGIDPGILSIAREVPVWACPITGFWAAEGEHVTLQSNAPGDGSYYNIPVRVHITQISPTWSFMRVRHFGVPESQLILLPSEADHLPPQILESHNRGQIRIQGKVVRTSDYGQEDWDPKEDWAQTRKGLLAGTNGLLRLISPNLSDDMTTPDRIRDLWETQLQAIVDTPPQSYRTPTIAHWLFGSYHDHAEYGPGRREEKPNIPLVHLTSGAVVLLDTKAAHGLSSDVWRLPALAKGLLSYRPLSPSDPADYQTFARAMARGTIEMVWAAGRHETVPDGLALTEFPAAKPTRSRSDLEAEWSVLRRVGSGWFGRSLYYLPQREWEMTRGIKPRSGRGSSRPEPA